MYPKKCYSCLRTPVTYVPGLYTLFLRGKLTTKDEIAALHSHSFVPLAKTPLFLLSGDRYLVAWPRQDPPFDKLQASPKGYAGSPYGS